MGRAEMERLGYNKPKCELQNKRGMRGGIMCESGLDVNGSGKSLRRNYGYRWGAIAGLELRETKKELHGIIGEYLHLWGLQGTKKRGKPEFTLKHRELVGAQRRSCPKPTKCSEVLRHDSAGPTGIRVKHVHLAEGGEKGKKAEESGSID